MNRDEFWQVIENSRRASDLGAQIESLIQQLSASPLIELVDFHKHVWTLLAESYRWELWGAAYIIHGGCSDDCFDYFRGLLIGLGRDWFERALANPDSLADLPWLVEGVELEDILGVADHVYKAKTDNDIWEEAELSIPEPILGEGWDFGDRDEMRRRYPKLCEKFRW